MEKIKHTYYSTDKKLLNISGYNSPAFFLLMGVYLELSCPKMAHIVLIAVPCFAAQHNASIYCLT